MKAAFLLPVVAVADVPLTMSWGDYKNEFGMAFNGEEDATREQVFNANIAIIESENAKDNTHVLGVNQFAHLSFEEFSAQYLNAKGSAVSDDDAHLGELEVQSEVASTVDWSTDKSVVNPVKDQGQCGSCWAFSATCAIEGAHFKQTGTLLSLSEQQLVDCDAQSDGCNGGLQEYAMDYLEKNQQETESDYPYKAADGKCQTDASEGKVLVAQIHDVKPESVDQLKAAIAQGPVSVTIEADKTVFQMYSGGIFDSTLCGTDLDHAVTAVGYGSDVDRDYYIVRNSWGASWGEQGYIRILATKGKGICGIQQVSLWPSTN